MITAIVVNPLQRKLAKRTSVHCTEVCFANFFSSGFFTVIEVNLAKRTTVQNHIN